MPMRKPTFSRSLAQRLAALFAALLVLAAAAPAALASIPDRPENRYVLDSAGVLSRDLEDEIIEENQRLFEDYGAEVVVVAVDFFGGQDREDYANQLFNRWGIGSRERNNGILLVLAVGEEDYYATAGLGIEDYFDGALLDDLLYEYLEPDFAKEKYDAGVKKFFRAVVDELDSYYSHTSVGNGRPYDDGVDDYSRDDTNLHGAGHAVKQVVFFSLLRVAVVIIVLLVVFSLIKRAGRGGSPGPGPGPGAGGGSGFWQGMFIGSALNRRRRPPWGAPPPPPPPPGGFGGFGGFGGPGPRPPRPPRPGGFGGHSGGFSSGGRSSGFGGGGRPSRGGGGRSGSGFHSGGSSRGGGAGRRR